MNNTIQNTMSNHVVDDNNQTVVISQEEEDKFMVGRRTSKEWWDFFPAMSSVALIVIGALNLDNCDSIPVLPSYLIIFGAINVALAVIKIVWRTDRVVILPPVSSSASTAEQDGEEAGGQPAPKPHPMKYVVDVLGISLLGVAIWGAVLTFPEVGDYWGEDKTVQSSCSAVIFVSALVSAAIMIAIIGVMLIGAIGIFLLAKIRSDKKDATPAEESDV